MSDCTAILTTDVSIEERSAIEGFLMAHNLKMTAREDYRPLQVVLRDAEGRAAEGLLGATYWDWLYVDTLALSDKEVTHLWMLPNRRALV